MHDPILELYESRPYPAMSHPSSDPAVTAVAARMAGLETRHPSAARVLELGCGSGHNLIPLAMRWPNSRFVGVDFCGSAIALARELAQAAGVENIEFCEVDLREFDPRGERFNYLIAHGVFSWVPDEVKAALFAGCSQWLAEDGIATVSFNLESGWMLRFPVIEKVRAIMHAGAEDEVRALELLQSVTDEDSAEWGIIEDMLQKGGAILPFDDLAPVNDPWSLRNFVAAADQAGLRWLGESVAGQNFPDNLEDRELAELKAEHQNLIDLQSAADALAGRQFRSAMLTRNDALVQSRVSLGVLMETSVSLKMQKSLSNRLRHQFLREKNSEYSHHALKDVLAGLSTESQGECLIEAVEAIARGWLGARIEPLKPMGHAPDFPRLNAFRLECARRRLPLVDGCHQACGFPTEHYQVLARMDGRTQKDDLAIFAREACPELDFHPWLQHLAERGMFD